MIFLKLENIHFSCSHRMYLSKGQHIKVLCSQKIIILHATTFHDFFTQCLRSFSFSVAAKLLLCIFWKKSIVVCVLHGGHVVSMETGLYCLFTWKDMKVFQKKLKIMSFHLKPQHITLCCTIVSYKLLLMCYEFIIFYILYPTQASFSLFVTVLLLFYQNIDVTFGFVELC